MIQMISLNVWGVRHIHRLSAVLFLFSFFLNEANTYLLSVITCCFHIFPVVLTDDMEEKSHFHLHMHKKKNHYSCARWSPRCSGTNYCPVIHGSNQFALLSHWAVPVSLWSHLEHSPVQNSLWIIVPLQQRDEWIESVSVWFLIHTDYTWTAQLFVIYCLLQGHREKQLESLF